MQAGETIALGAPIGTLGKSGYADLAHLHLEMTTGGVLPTSDDGYNPNGAPADWIDPYAFIESMSGDNPQPIISVADSSANESDGQIRFEISLDRPPAADKPVTVNYRTVDTGSATGGPDNSPGNDYGDLSGVLEFTSTDPLTKLTAPISIFDDATPEPDETFQLLLENPTNATLADDRATATIIDDDTSPPVDDILVRIERVGAEETPEGNTLSKEGHVEDVVDRLLSFRVSLLEPAPEDILIGWEVRPVDLGFGIGAADKYDFALDQLPSGQVSISKGTSGAFIDTIQLGGDWDFEPDEAFEVVLSSVPDGFAVDPKSGSATAIIGNDDQEFSTNGNILTEAATIAGFAYGSDPAAAITAGWIPIENLITHKPQPASTADTASAGCGQPPN